MLSALAGTPLDRIVVQVGGGAMASSIIQAFTEARSRIGSPLPLFHAVQTRGAFPLMRAYDRVEDWMKAHGAGVEAAFRHAVTHRSGFMWPWEEAPHSLAHGILDDETYDWAAVVKGLLESGGTPIVVTDEDLTGACDLANTARGTGARARAAERSAPRKDCRAALPVDHTGAAGVAGLRRLVKQGTVGPGERVAVIFSGARRT